MSEQRGAESAALIRKVQEMTETWPALAVKLEAWPGAVGDSVGNALTVWMQGAMAQSLRETQSLRSEWETQLQSLTAERERLTGLIARQEEQAQGWLLGLSRDHWKGLLVAVLVSLVVSGGVILYREAFGAQARALEQAQALNTIYQNLWAELSDKERADLEKRRAATVQARNKKAAAQ